MQKIELKWFTKAMKKPDDVNNPSAIQQGNWTDYAPDPYMQRMQNDPMGIDEIEAWNWIMNKMIEDHPQARPRQSVLIDYALDDGWLYIDDAGMLRVSEESPV